MRFLHWYFFGSLALLAGVGVYSFLKRKTRRPYFAFSHMPGAFFKYAGIRANLISLPVLLRYLALAFAVIALARPQKADTTVKRNVEGIDIVVALDVSDSMLIEDMAPENRLEASKEVIKKFIEGRNSDRVGLVVFAGESYTKVPPTLDYPILQKSLKETTTENNMKMGTAIGVALANAVARLQDSAAKTRIIILLTDGASNTGTIAPEEALSIAKGYGIKVYTIATGKEGQAMLPVYRTDSSGRKIKAGYQPMMSSVNRELLAQIASETGGEFYFADDSETLSNVFQRIDRLEKTKIDVNEYTKYTELFESYILYSLILYVLATILDFSVFRRYP